MSTTNGTHHETTEEQIDRLYAYFPGATPPPAPLPEAPASVNCHLLIEGRQVQITLRDTDETRLLARLTAVLAQYPVPASTVVAAQPTGESPTPQCPQHGFLRRGKRGWYCPVKVGDGYCTFTVKAGTP
jgi:hypothetical protein